jgi:two-component system sensor histidine kinase CpxA
MSRLFWRIFLSFWLVIVLTLALAVTGNSIVFRAELENVRLESLRGTLDALAEQAERELRRGGEEGLRDWLRRRARNPSLPLLLVLGPDDGELLGRPLPPGPARAVERWQRLQEDEQRMRPRRAPARRISDADGRTYLLFAAPPQPRAGGLFLRPEARFSVLLIALLLSGLTCFWLARQVTRPVRALRAAGQRIADGDLAARAGAVAATRSDELGELARDFDRMAGRIEALVTAQTRLLRDVSHELRSPLTRLQVAIGLLRQHGGSATAADLDRLDQEIARLDALIDQVLTLTRLNSQAAPAREPLPLAGLLQELVDDACFEGGALGRTVALEVHGDPALRGDQRLLRSALDNVIRNALEHSRHAVQVGLWADAGSARIEVRDDGPGVPPADVGRIFTPFVTLPGASGRQGSGLGLAIAHRAVELHGGTIEAENSPGGGLRVRVRIPTVTGAGGGSGLGISVLP